LRHMSSLGCHQPKNPDRAKGSRGKKIDRKETEPTARLGKKDRGGKGGKANFIWFGGGDRGPAHRHT